MKPQGFMNGDITEHGYAIVPTRALTDQKLTLDDLRVLAMFGYFSDDDNTERKAKALLADDIAKLLCLDSQSVITIREKLHDMGYIQEHEAGFYTIIPVAIDNKAEG